MMVVLMEMVMALLQGSNEIKPHVLPNTGEERNSLVGYFYGETGA